MTVYERAVQAVREAMDSLYDAVMVYDPNAEYSDEQVLLIAAQTLGQAMPAIETAIEALDEVPE